MSIKRSKPKFSDHIGNYLPLLFSLILGGFLLCVDFNKPSLNNKNDLLDLNDNIRKYSFKKTIGYKRTSLEYYFWTDSYKCTFQISANFARCFFQEDFEKKFTTNKAFKFSVPKYLKGNLYEPKEKIIIFSLEDNNVTYLDSNLTLAYYNDNFGNILATTIIIIGIGLQVYVFRRKIFP